MAEYIEASISEVDEGREYETELSGSNGKVTQESQKISQNVKSDTVSHLESVWSEPDAKREIAKLTNEAMRLAESTYENGKAHVRTAIICGEWLRITKQKLKENHGEQFQDWIRINFPQFTYRTAARWMLLANRYFKDVEKGEMPAFETIRQAYLSAGVIEEKKRIELGHEEKMQAIRDYNEKTNMPEQLSTALLPFTRWHNREYRKLIQQANRATLENWLKDLKEPHELYVEISNKLSR